MVNSFKGIKQKAESFMVVQKSKFYNFAIPVFSKEEVNEYLTWFREKYYDATHVCYAYVVNDNGVMEKYSDDGEPSGTAGSPILKIVLEQGLSNVLVVVTRYFGGIKLGAGGLVRAYSGSCAEALKSATKVHMTDCTIAEVVVDYSLLKGLRKVLAGKVVEKDVIWEDKVRLILLFPTVSWQTISHIVTENTLGKCVLQQKEQLLCHYEQN